jgi:hypothetical protein
MRTRALAFAISVLASISCAWGQNDPPLTAAARLQAFRERASNLRLPTFDSAAQTLSGGGQNAGAMEWDGKSPRLSVQIRVEMPSASSEIGADPTNAATQAAQVLREIVDRQCATLAASFDSGCKMLASHIGAGQNARQSAVGDATALFQLSTTLVRPDK